SPLSLRSAPWIAHRHLLHAVVEKVVGAPVSLMGNSMGGHIAVIEAAEHPRWVTELTLVDPAVGIPVRRQHPVMLGLVAAISIPGLAEAFFERRLQVLGPERLVQQTLALVSADPSRVDPKVVEAHVQLTRERSRLARQNSRAFLQEIGRAHVR